MQQPLSENKINRLLDEGIRFKPTEYVSKGFAIINKNAGLFIGFFVLYMIVAAIASSLESSLLGGRSSILSTILASLWLPGIYIVSRKINLQQPQEFKHFFEGHQYAGKLIGTGILTRLIPSLPIIPAVISLFVFDNIIEQSATFMSAAESGELIFPTIGSLSVVLIILGVIGALFLQIIYIFAMPLSLFTTLSVWESMETSRKVATKALLPILGLLLLQFLLILLGTLMLFIGLLYMLPAIFCINYAAFEDVFQLEKDLEGSEEDILNHIVD